MTSTLFGKNHSFPKTFVLSSTSGRRSSSDEDSVMKMSDRERIGGCGLRNSVVRSSQFKSRVDPQGLSLGLAPIIE